MTKSFDDGPTRKWRARFKRLADVKEDITPESQVAVDTAMKVVIANATVAGGRATEIYSGILGDVTSTESVVNVDMTIKARHAASTELGDSQNKGLGFVTAANQQVEQDIRIIIDRALDSAKE